MMGCTESKGKTEKKPHSCTKQKQSSEAGQREGRKEMGMEVQDHCKHPLVMHTSAPCEVL